MNGDTYTVNMVKKAVREAQAAGLLPRCGVSVSRLDTTGLQLVVPSAHLAAFQDWRDRNFPRKYALGMLAARLVVVA